MVSTATNGWWQRSSDTNRSFTARLIGRLRRDAKRYDSPQERALALSTLHQMLCHSGCAEIYTLLTMVSTQRYTIMQELVNFMAPVNIGADGQHDDDDDDRVDVSRLLVGNLFRSV